MGWAVRGWGVCFPQDLTEVFSVLNGMGFLIFLSRRSPCCQQYHTVWLSGCDSGPNFYLYCKLTWVRTGPKVEMCHHPQCQQLRHSGTFCPVSINAISDDAQALRAFFSLLTVQNQDQGTDPVFFSGSELATKSSQEKSFTCVSQ